ncbi:MAG TPA: LamG-like jellyroll fold domain-containing protein, partial [Candidatus Limnocylindria bacterium]|nr:LamG-like jellyroll fold domain-containing protein [Candidatus Limnocylindria bacterium]
GDLYAATWEGPPSDRGHVYRLGSDGWVDCGSPWDCNAVTRLAVHDGRLYAGVTRLRGGGSGLPDSANQHPGGRVLRYDGGTEWTDLGGLGDADSVAALVPWNGDLYAIPMYSAGLYRMDAPGRWTWCGSPGRRLLALGVHDGALHGAGNDHVDVASAIAQTAAGIVVAAESPEGGGGVFRYAGGESWASLGLQRDTTQVYSIETFDGAMHIGTWPTGLVYRHAGGTSWESTGRLGDETEVMNLLAFGGSLYGGTLPKAQVFRMDGPDAWSEIGRVDATPDVLYRRAASMAVHRGTVVVGTLPSGRVHAMRVGAAVTGGQPVTAGEHDIAAVRRGPTLDLYLDGVLLASETAPDGTILDLGEAADLQRGNGPRTRFGGELLDIEVMDRALSPEDVAGAARRNARG